MRKLKLDELNRISVDQFKQSDKIPLVIVLDNIRSLSNIGSIFRTADAFRVAKIYLCGITATPPHKEIHKTALGATESVDWEYVDESLTCVEKLKNEGYTLLAVEQAENSVLLDEYQPPHGEKFALILGHEVKGVDQAVINNCHTCIEIPQEGTKHSLNVSVCGGIVMWEFFRKLFVNA